MRRAGTQGAVGVALAALLLCACRTAPVTARAPPPVPAPPAEPRVMVAPQPGKVIAEVNGIAVLALSLPEFARLPREQRLLALEVAQAGAAGEAVALDQTWRHDLALVHVLHGILSKPWVVPPALLARVRGFARLVWLNGGLHDAQTGRKQQPPFTAADLRTAALAAQAAGAEFKLGSVSLELALRALEPALFDPAVDPLRTARGEDLTRSAVKQAIRIPGAAAALDLALSHAAPPQSAVLGPLSAFLRGGEPGAFREAQRAFVDAAGAVDFFAGFFDRSFDPRGRKAVFGAFAGVRDEQGTALLQRVAAPAKRAETLEALQLAAASGSMLPLRSFAVRLPLERADREVAGTKIALFAGAAEAVARVRTDAALLALADPSVVPQLAPCLPLLRTLELGTPTPIFVGATKIGGGVPICQGLWPQFVAASLLLSFADVPAGDRVDDEVSRAHQLELWWLTSKGALVERRDGQRRFFAVPDPARFQAAASELLQLLQEIERTGDDARLAGLLQQHASRLDTRLRDEVLERLRAAGIPQRVAVIPPRLVPVLADGKLQDAQAVAVDDLDAEILRRWDEL